MSLRTKLLLSLTLLALIPLILFGFTANAAATSSLISIEQDNLKDAITSVKGGLTYIQGKTADTLKDNSNWDDIHEAVGKDPADMDFFTKNFDPTNQATTTNIFDLKIVGAWNRANQLVYKIGPIDEFLSQTHATVQDALNTDETKTTLLTFGSDIYTVSYRSIRTTAGTDPNGMLAFGHKLGADDLAQLHKLTGYDIALYNGQTAVASTMNESSVTPAAIALSRAETGQDVFDQTNADIAFAYSPLFDGNKRVVGVFVIARPRIATRAAQNSITSTLALVFVFGGVLGVIVAFVLGRSITRPLLTMANTADKIAAGDLAQRVSAPSNDELGRLARAFNQMTEKVEQRVADSEKESTRLQELDEFRLNLLTAITEALQSPVKNIKNHVSTLGMSRFGTLNEAQRRSVEAIARSASIEDALLADLIDFSRAQQKQLRVVRERMSLKDILQHVIKPIEESHKGKSIQFRSLIPEDLPNVFADRTRMEQVLSGLIDWAYDYSALNGQVTVSASTLPGKVRVAVTDTSHGLPQDELPKIFNLFYHPTGGNSMHNNGQVEKTDNGLGLALLKALIEQQGGTITVEAEQNKGNTFTFVLPSTT